jgi:hypothetical protein
VLFGYDRLRRKSNVTQQLNDKKNKNGNDRATTTKICVGLCVGCVAWVRRCACRADGERWKAEACFTDNLGGPMSIVEHGT